MQNMIAVDSAIAIVLGANIGMTSTALLASSVMSLQARAVAISNLFFNIIGVLLIWPFLKYFNGLVECISSNSNVGLGLATAHFAFNLFTGVVFLIFLTPFERIVLSYQNRNNSNLEQLSRKFKAIVI